MESIFCFKTIFCSEERVGGDEMRHTGSRETGEQAMAMVRMRDGVA